MYKAIQTVRHNHRRFEKGDTIKDIKKEEGQRLVDLGAAVRIGGNQSKPDVADSVDYKKLLNDDFKADELKEAAVVAGVVFDEKTTKADLIDDIIEQEKAEEILAEGEDDEEDGE